jgi:hypothetical protein
MSENSALDSVGKKLGPEGMSVDTGQMKFVEETSSVKCCLRKAVMRAGGRKNETGRFLTKQQFAKFRRDVDRIVRVISMMQRRASLAMLYHVTKSMASSRLPFDIDVRKTSAESTWWKNWLRIGAAPEDTSDPLVAPDQRVRESYMDIADSLGEAPRLPANVDTCFDQVLGFAAISFQTAFVNNMWFPLIPRLERLVAALVKEAKGEDGEEEKPEESDEKEHDEKEVTKYRMMSAIRSGIVPRAWPASMRQMARDIRERLVTGAIRECLQLLKTKKLVEPIDVPADAQILAKGVLVVPEHWPKELRDMAEAPMFIWDDFGKSTCDCDDLLRFNWWMQTEFARLGKRQMRLCPVMGVTRQHVRLDRKVLGSMLLRYIPEEDEELVELNDLCLDISTELKDPRESLPAVPRKKKRETAEYTRARVAAQNAREDMEDSKEHKELVKKYNASKSGIRNPDRDLPKLPAKPNVKPKKDVTPEEHQLLQEAYDAAVEVQNKAKLEEAYVKRKERHDRRTALEARIIGSFFHLPAHAVKGKGEWQPSVATDGISVTFNFVKRVPVPPAQDKPARRMAPAKVSEKNRKFAEALDCTVADVPGGQRVAVLSLDPGRVSLATVVLRCGNKTFVRRLSRGKFRNDSGVDGADRAHTKRWACMGDAWAKLQDGGALRTTQPAQIAGYLLEYRQIVAEWWERAMRVTEAQARLSAYGGKKRALDRFFGELRRDARAFLIECLGEVEGRATVLEVAYGSAGPNMKCGGRGEMSVPTTGTFKACCRAFKSDQERVTLVDEFRTTMYGWNGAKKEKAYKKVAVVDGKPHVTMRHTTARYTPVVREEDREAFNQWQRERRAMASKRRGGNGLPKKPFWPVQLGPKKEKKQRYPECRGLRFCPETRMFFDRDLCSAMNIGKLRVLELLRRARPTHFCRQSKSRRQTEEAQADGVAACATGNDAGLTPC